MRRVGLCGLFLVWLTLSACSKEPDANAALIDFVPQGSPYVVASGAPFPEEYVARMSEFGKRIQPSIEEDLASTLETTDFSEPTRKALGALFSRLVNLNYAESWNRPFVVYGRGLAPTFRGEIGQPDELRALFDELDADPALPVEAAERDGQKYWRLPLDEWVALATLANGAIAFGATTTADEADLLDHLLSPASGDGDAITRTIDAVRKQYGFSDQAAGYLDTAALVAAGNAGSGMDPACLKEIEGYAQIAPRMLAGYDDVSASSMTFRGVVELEPSIAQEIVTWSAPVPGLGGTDALFSFGMGIDLQKALTTAASWQQQLKQRGSACGLSGDAVDPATLPGVLMMMGVAGNPKGLRFTLDGLPTDLAVGGNWLVSAMLTAENPEATAALASGQLPVNSLLSSKGTPVELPLGPLMQSPTPVWALLTDNAIGVSTGPDAEKRVQAIVNAPPAPEGTLLGMEFDMGKLADTVLPQLAEGGMLKSMMLAQAAASGDPAAVEQAERDIDRSIEMLQLYGQLLSRFVMTVRATPAGLELSETVAIR